MEEIGRLGQADIAVQLKLSAERLSVAQKITACRIACEAANNGARYGQADKFPVGLSMARGGRERADLFAAFQFT